MKTEKIDLFLHKKINLLIDQELQVQSIPPLSQSFGSFFYLIKIGEDFYST